jgi:predicted transcriptional regulator
LEALFPSKFSALVTSNDIHANSHKLEQNLLEYIDRNPGIRYRQLLRLTDSSNGVLSYHLAELEGSTRIKVDRKRGVTRYYPLYISTEISKIIGHIRNSVSRQIISLLVQNNGCTLGEIAACTMKAPSTVSWHLQRLINAGIVKKNSVGKSDGFIYKSSSFHVSDKVLIENVLSNYLESPLDRIVNDYSELIDELRG